VLLRGEGFPQPALNGRFPRACFSRSCGGDNVSVLNIYITDLHIKT
jgi:hypothetical protein